MTNTLNNGHLDNVDGDQVNNDGKVAIEMGIPYTVTVRIEGTSGMLMHRYSVESVEAKGAAAKGSKAKKTDDIESYVYRDENGIIGMPGVYLKGAIAGPQGSAKFRQDPRSTRKSALDLYRAGVQVLTDLAPITNSKGEPASTWDSLDTRRVMVQRSAVPRVRPFFVPGWSAEFFISVLTPEYISPTDLLDVLTNAGKLVGVADFRPTYGRFQVTSFDLGLLA